MFAQVKRLFVTAVVVSAFSIIIFVIVPAILNFDGVQRFNGFEFLADQLSTLILMITAINSLVPSSYLVDYRAYQKKKDEFNDKITFRTVMASALDHAGTLLGGAARPPPLLPPMSEMWGRVTLRRR